MGKGIPYLIGVDEAGRGPVLGDMVIAFVVVREENIELLKHIGVKDSKNLTPQKRLQLMEKIISIADIVVTTSISPIEIDYNNLNKVTLERIKYILNRIAKLIANNGYIKRITIDMVSGYRRYWNQLEWITQNTKVIFIEKADVRYPEVSAASIVAKVVRDNSLYSLKRLYGDFGSGYPTDPKTIKWIKETYMKSENPPPIVRRSWRILEEVASKWYMRKRMLLSTYKKTLLDYIDSEN